MSTEPRPLLPLTPTERRIAEMAFATDAIDREWAAILAVARLRGDRLGYTEAEERAACEAMLEELRRDHVDSMLMHNRALATERDRYRALLERIVAAIPTAFGHQAECVCAQCEAAGQAVLDARTELGL